MKKNHLFTLASCACALLLSACSTELDTVDNPTHVGDNEALLSVSLQFSQADKPAGYAPGDLGDDVLPGVALPAEKEIKSIAFIAFTDEGTSVYLSENPTLSENGFTKPLTPVDEAVPGEYTVQFKIRSTQFGAKTCIVAIANYQEHGLTFDAATLTLDGLKKKLSDELAAEADKNFIQYPLLMSASFDGPIVEGSTVPISFVMERILARVDVVNNAYDKAEPANGFVLTSAQLTSAPTQGMLMPGQTAVAPSGYIDLVVQNDVKELAPADDGQPVSPTNPARQQLAPMYVYENSNTDKDDPTKLSATATWVLVKGTYQGQDYEKKIEFRTQKKNVTGVIVGGVIVPLARNTRYVVEISSSTENELTFDVKVTDWAEGKQLDVEIDFKAPVLEGLDQIPPVTSGATWDAATKTLNITDATAPVELNFLVRGFQDTDFTVEKEYDENAIKVIDGVKVKRGELSGYADAVAPGEEAPLVRTYKVTIPKAEGECPSLTKIIVYNAAYADAQTEINVKYAPFFMGDWRKDNAITIDPATRLVDLKNVANNQAGTITFFASANAAFDATLVNKGLTNDFYTIATDDETDLATTKKYGPGKRVTLSYKALTNNPELAEVSVKETGADAATAKKLYVKSFKKAYFESSVFSITDNSMNDGDDILYMAINNGDHGSIDYTVYDDVNKNTFVPDASATTYAVALTSPNWVREGIGAPIIGDAIETVSAEFGIVKRIIKIPLPKAIKNPALANLKVGLLGEPNGIKLVPVYPLNTPLTEADWSLAPVCVKGVWWAPINIGQTKISTINNPSTEGGNLFQWGRKQALTWASPTTVGPLAPTAPEVTQDKFIIPAVSPYDWCNAPNNKFWNSGTDAAPTKVVANDPCPAGWRVPSKDEWAMSIVGSGTPVHQWQQATAPGAAQNGLLTVTGEGDAKLYFPAAGLRNLDGSVVSQGASGFYWASAENGTNASGVSFGNATVSVSNHIRAGGLTVRCVQDL